MISIKSEKEIKIMREGGRILATIMEEIKIMVKPGISTGELNKAAEGLVLKYGTEPSFKGYDGFPAVLCVSINEEVVHGVPGKRLLKEGDIVSLDLGLLYKGFHSDMAVTVPVGDIAPEASRLLRITKKALKRAIKKIRPGNTVGDVGNTIQRCVEEQEFDVVRDLCGHGIGRQLHEEPNVLNYGKRRKGAIIKEGMVLCPEPMVTIGKGRVKRAINGFAFETADGSLSAHFEHTVAVTKRGCRVLTNI